jgi:N-dimethylarginine dimethylaminohydrolase
MDTFNFEGGDVLLHQFEGKTIIFVGISDLHAEHAAATKIEFAEYLREIYPDYVIYPVFLDKHVLHLDLIFNILPFGNRCLLYPGGLNKKFEKAFIDYLAHIFTTVQIVSEKDSDEYVCNFINTGPNAMIVSDSPNMKRLVAGWRKEFSDLKISLIDFKEVYTKLSGSIRCSTLPIIRGASDRMHVTNEIDKLHVCMVGTLTPDKTTRTCVTAIGDIKSTNRQAMLAKIAEELDTLSTTLMEHGVRVLRPDITKLGDVPACNVIFARDVLLIIGSDLLKSNLHLPHRKMEYVPYLKSIETFFTGASSPQQPVTRRVTRSRP